MVIHFLNYFLKPLLYRNYEENYHHLLCDISFYRQFMNTSFRLKAGEIGCGFHLISAGAIERHSSFVAAILLNHSSIKVISMLVQFVRGRLDVSLFIYLFICWSSRVAFFLLCYYSIAPCTSKGDISTSAFSHLWRVILIAWYIGRPS